MAQPVSTPPLSFQRTIAAWVGPSGGRVERRAPPSSHRIAFRVRSFAFGSVVLGVDLEEAWRHGVRELGAGPLSAMLDAAFEAAALTVSETPLHPLSLEVQAFGSFELRAGPVTAEAHVVEALGPDCLLEGRVCTAVGKVLATGRARFGPPPGAGPATFAGARHA